jgi:hypothetical protein
MEQADSDAGNSSTGSNAGTARQTERWGTAAVVSMELDLLESSPRQQMQKIC